MLVRWGGQGFRYEEPEQGEGYGRDAAEREKRNPEAEIIDYFSAEEIAEGCADADRCGECALCEVEATAAAGEIGDHENRNYNEDRVGDAVEQLDGDEADHVVGEGVENGTNGQYTKAEKKQRLSAM